MMILKRARAAPLNAEYSFSNVNDTFLLRLTQTPKRVLYSYNTIGYVLPTYSSVAMWFLSTIHTYYARGKDILMNNRAIIL